MKINKIQNVIMCVLFFLIVVCIFFNPLSILDEVWNFQNIVKMCNGFKIYSESNVIITPIFFYLGKVLLKLFGIAAVTFRVYGLVIYIILFVLIYLALKNLKIKKSIRIIYVTLIFEFMFPILTCGANYNTLAIVMVFLGLNLYISKKSNNFIQGILIFLIFFTKQNIGVIYALIVVIYEFFRDLFSKKFIISQLKKFSVFIILLSCNVIYMKLNGNLIDCINYTLGGLFDFGTSNFVIVAPGYYWVLTISVIALYIGIALKKDTLFVQVIDEDIFKNLTLLFIFSIGITFIIFPIVNQGHFTLVLPFYLIFLFYLFNQIFIEDIFGDEKYNNNIKWITILLLCIVLMRCGVEIITYYNEVSFVTDKGSKFYGISLYKEDIEKFGNIKNYIIEKNSEGIDVIVFSYEAAMVMIDLNQSHGAYDLPFNGNLGYDGVNKMEQDILSKKNTEFLIFTDEKDMFWQESKEIRDCIINNLNYVGNIENYSIYSTEEQ